jgi:threonine aldolase
MRQSGVLAAMGLYAVQNNVQRLADDHARARQLATVLQKAGYVLPQKVHTNLVFFGLPADCAMTPHSFVETLHRHWGVKVGSGYTRHYQSDTTDHIGSSLMRAVVHLDVNDEDLEYAAQAMIESLTQYG